MDFPKEVKEEMKECILKVIWPKEDIIKLLTNCGCDRSDIKAAGNPRNTSRENILYKVFKKLSKNSNNGKPQFHAMLEKLINWTNFDALYFEKLEKLDLEEAKEAIKQLQEAKELYM